jgi:hypothetical protein
MNDIADIARQAEAAWHRGQQAERAGRLQEAHGQFRLAHDLVVDCPRLHHVAHQHLRRLNARRHAWRELATDLILLGLAPLAIFELVAFLMKRQVLGGLICARSRAQP